MRKTSNPTAKMAHFRPPAAYGRTPTRLFLGLLLAARLLTAATAAPDAAPAVAARMISSIEDYASLPPDQLARPHRVHLEVRVNYQDPAWGNFWFEDRSGRGYLPLSAHPPALRPNQRVLIDGVIIPSVGLEASRVTVTVLADPDPSPAEAVARRLGDLV